VNGDEAQVTVTAPGRVEVHGPMTFRTASRVCAAGIECLSRDASPAVVVDCATVAPADSAGLAVLIEWRRWALRRGHHLTFVNLPAQISAIAHLSEVSALLDDAAA
jgi:phospholipid transport system transporter-binding protein